MNTTLQLSVTATEGDLIIEGLNALLQQRYNAFAAGPLMGSEYYGIPPVQILLDKLQDTLWVRTRTAKGGRA